MCRGCMSFHGAVVSPLLSFILMSGLTCAQVAGAAGACGALCDGRGGLHAARGVSGRCAHGGHLQTHPGLSKENQIKERLCMI